MEAAEIFSCGPGARGLESMHFRKEMPRDFSPLFASHVREFSCLYYFISVDDLVLFCQRM